MSSLNEYAGLEALPFVVLIWLFTSTSPCVIIAVCGEPSPVICNVPSQVKLVPAVITVEGVVLKLEFAVTSLLALT